MSRPEGEFSVAVPPHWLSELEGNRAYFEQFVREALAQRLMQADSAEARLELVRTICRAKASVCNWGDLEREILEASSC